MYQQALDLVTQASKQPCWNGTFKAKFATAYLTEKKRQNVQQLQQDMQPLKAQLSDTEWQQQYQRRLEDVSLTSRKFEYDHQSSKN